MSLLRYFLVQKKCFLKLQVLLGDPDIGGRITVTWILNILREHRLFLFGSGLAAVVVCCEHGNESLGSINCNEFFTLRMEVIVHICCDCESLSARS
jgi:hypothetical protein